MRGKPPVRAVAPLGVRSIPACAGEAAPPASPATGKRVYPRVCGGSGGTAKTAHRASGLSPRVRGKPDAQMSIQSGTRSIPACAGEAASLWRLCRPGWVYPRVCGGSASGAGCSIFIFGLSPRVRGKRAAFVSWPTRYRSIPACAGEASCAFRAGASAEVYPRVCGGSLVTRRRGNGGGGLSPRVRGKRAGAPGLPAERRSIPACAGEAPQLT